MTRFGTLGTEVDAVALLLCNMTDANRGELGSIKASLSGSLAGASNFFRYCDSIRVLKAHF
jgi:hypothetical protein